MTWLWCQYCQLWKDSTSLLSISFLNFRNYFWLRLPAEVKVQTSKSYATCKGDGNYAILTKLFKLQDKKKPISNLLNIQSVGFEQRFMKFIDSSDVWCLELYLINTFTKSTKADRCRCSSWLFFVYLLLLKIQIYNKDRYEDIF